MKALLVGLLLFAGCDKKPAAPAAVETKAPTTRELVAELDKVCEQSISAPNHAEAREWLSGSDESHNTVKLGRTRSAALADQLYKAGAEKVYVTGIQTSNATDVANALIAVLPNDPAARKAVFDVEAAFRREADEAPTPDAGEKYLRLSLE